MSKTKAFSTFLYWQCGCLSGKCKIFEREVALMSGECEGH